MPSKTRKTAKGRARARCRNGRLDEGAVDVRTRAKDCCKSGASGKSAPRARFRITISRIGGDAFGYGIKSNTGERIFSSSRLYGTAQAATSALTELVTAIQAGDFETFDCTGDGGVPVVVGRCGGAAAVAKLVATAWLT